MRIHLLVLFFIGFLFVIQSCKPPKNQFVYPVTAKDNTVDTIWGELIPDPYRWLEDEASIATEEWVSAQKKVTSNYLSGLPNTSELRESLTKSFDFKRVLFSAAQQDTLYFSENSFENSATVLYRQIGKSTPEVLFDPNLYSHIITTNSFVRYLGFSSPYIAFTVQEMGSDWQKLYFYDWQKKELLSDVLVGLKFLEISPGWYKNGVFYSRYETPKHGVIVAAKVKNNKVYYHRFGTTQEEDILVYDNEEGSSKAFFVKTFPSENLLFLEEMNYTRGNALHVKKLSKNDVSKEKWEFRPIISSTDYVFSVVGVKDNIIYVKTNYKAPKFKLVAIDLNQLEESSWKTIIPESSLVLSDASLLHDKVICKYTKDAYNLVRILDLPSQTFKDVNLPKYSSIHRFIVDEVNNTFYFLSNSFIHPPTLYKYALHQPKLEVFWQTKLAYNMGGFDVKQVFYPSKDGTKIPMFVVHKKGLVLNGENPTLMSGYGGFGSIVLPYFDPSVIPFLNKGGVFVSCNLRGGGEYGDTWHKSATRVNKQKTFDDFIAAAEYLVANNYTNPDKLAALGTSNGGLLVSAVMLQRPDLFKVIVSRYGVHDMLRFHEFTVGKAWIGDYGSISDSLEFRALLNYSPVHNVKKEVTYPAVLCITADHDDRVVPAHSYKFIATMQEKTTGVNPALCLVSSRQGHGNREAFSTKLVENLADIYAFIYYHLEIK